MTDTPASGSKNLRVVTSVSTNADCTRYSSPVKRKRTNSSAAETAGNNLRQRTDGQTGSPQRIEFGSESPRTAVSTRFSTLQLDNKQTQASGGDQTAVKTATLAGNLDLVGSPVAKEMARGEMMHFVGTSSEPSNATSASQCPVTESVNRPQTPPSLNGYATTRAPATPTLLPITSPTGDPAISPLNSAPSASIAAAISQGLQSLPPSNSSPSLGLLGSPSKRATNHHRSSKTIAESKTQLQSPSNRISKSKARRKSPPPAAAVNELVWSDAEITGHDPDDPNDDGYGINGIGFRPTPAMAEKRRNQRRKQIAEWKKREDTEKRSRRRELRNGHGNTHTLGSQKAMGYDFSDGKKVRFIDVGASGN